MQITPADVTVWAEEKPRALRVAWHNSALPTGVKIAKTVVQYKKVGDNDYVETQVLGSESEVSLTGLEFGTVYLVRVAMHPEDLTFNGSLLPTKYVGVFSGDVVATTFSRKCAYVCVCVCVSVCVCVCLCIRHVWLNVSLLVCMCFHMYVCIYIICVCVCTVFPATSIICFVFVVVRATFISNLLHYILLLLPTLSVPQSPILVASPSDYTSDSTTVSWATDLANELPVRHVVSVVAPDGNEVGRVLASADVGEASVSGLLPDTEYHVTVWAESNIGRSSNHSLLIHTKRTGMFVCEV